MKIGILLMCGIAISLGLDLYARSVCHGALISHINKKKLTFGVFVVAIYQITLLALGYGAAVFLQASKLSDKGDTINYIICMTIFTVIAIRMIRFAIKNEDIVEKRQDEKYMKKIFFSLCLQIGFYTFLTGVGFGLVRVVHISLLGILVLAGMVGVIAGLFSGYHYGYRLKTKAYAIGGALLLCMVWCMGNMYVF